MSCTEGGDRLPGAPSLWSGVRWRRRRAWRQRRSTSGSCERSRAPTRPASGPRSGTPGAGAMDRRARAGRAGCRLPRDRASGLLSAGPAPAPPLGESGERRPPSARRVFPPQPRRGVPSRWPAHSSVTPTAPLATLRAGAAFVLPSRRARLRATRARRADGGSYSKQIFPRGYHRSPSDANPVLS